MTTSKPEALSTQEKHRRAQLYARLTYASIIIVFVSICAIAVVSSMAMEKQREGYRPIEVSKPISFFDYTYVNDQPTKADSPGKPSTQPE